MSRGSGSKTYVKTEVRDYPRVSVSKLAEYLGATPTRRRSIIVEQKRPNPFRTARYTDAQRILVEAVEQGCEVSVFEAGIAGLESKFTRSDHEEECRQNCMLAVKAGLFLAGVLPLAKGSFEGTDLKHPAAIMIGDVEVSVRPEILMRVEKGPRAGKLGAVKFVFSKTHPMSDDAAECAGALLYEYMRQNFGEKAVSREHCFVIDVFANKCVTAPKSVIARMRDIVAACEEIARAWMALAA